MSEESARLWIKVSSKAARNAVQAWMGTTLKLSVTAAPERGRANEAVVELLAQRLKIAKTRIEIVAGHHQPRKQLLIVGLSADELRSRLG